MDRSLLSFAIDAMKVVLFCGGLGMRIREYADVIPKPMVPIGYRPLLWHVMKYYAHFGHRDFVLCLGYRGDVIKDYFLNYNECVSNDFVLRDGGKDVSLLNTDISDWRITFVDTGLHSNVAQRLAAVERHLDSDSEFLANYSDGLTDLHLPSQIEHFLQHDATASFISVKPNLSYHVVSVAQNGLVRNIEDIRTSGLRVNGGSFVFKREIFDYIRDGEELVLEPFQRLVAAQRLVAYDYDGFWAAMDTYKDRQLLEDMYLKGDARWQVWQSAQSGPSRPVAARRPAPAPPLLPLRAAGERR
jgi:glucose-1-phosphate cytidylyltransferase